MKSRSGWRLRSAVALIFALCFPAGLPVAVLAADGTPEISDTSITPSSAPSGALVTISATATATPCPAGGCVSSTGVIFDVALRIDRAFWAIMPNGFLQSMSAVDGAFGGAVEAVTGTIDTSALPDGPHRFCVFAEQDRHMNGTFGFPGDPACATLTIGNSAPTDIALSGAQVEETAEIGTTVGDLSTVDPDSGDTFTYSLVAGAGDADNEAFAIAGATVQTAVDDFDYDTQASYSIRVRTTDDGGLFFEEQFTIEVVRAPIGQITALFGDATIIHADGSLTPATIGSRVVTGDTIETAAGGAVHILFVDGTSFAVSENARLSIDQFVYDPQTESGSAFFRWLKGVFIYTSGLIGKNDPGAMYIELPFVGCCGIRGTEFIMAHDPGTGVSRIDLISGTVAISPTTEVQAPRTIVFDGATVRSIEPLAPEDYALHKAAILALFDGLNDAPTVDAGGPYAVQEGDTVELVATGSDPDDDALTYTWDLDGNGSFETPGQSVMFSAVGMNAPSTSSVAVRATDEAGLIATDTGFVDVTYLFAGFYQPVDALPALNSASAGRGIPIKFGLGGNQGLDIFSAGSPAATVIPCDSTTPVDGIEATATAGTSGLSYDALTDTYTYVWKTDKGWAGTCRQLVVTMDDGTSHRANFELTK